MAARVNKIRHDENTRAKIKAARLIDRLQDYALGDVWTPLDARRVSDLVEQSCC
jgi:hypothetical protein